MGRNIIDFYEKINRKILAKKKEMNWYKKSQQWFRGTRDPEFSGRDDISFGSEYEDIASDYAGEKGSVHKFTLKPGSKILKVRDRIELLEKITGKNLREEFEKFEKMPENEKPYSEIDWLVVQMGRQPSFDSRGGGEDFDELDKIQSFYLKNSGYDAVIIEESWGEGKEILVINQKAIELL